MKPATNRLSGCRKGLRRVDLLQQAFIDHRDAGGHGHGFHLIVGHVDKGGLELLVQLADIGAGLHAQLGIQVGERFVKQENFRLADDRPAYRHTLALAAGKLAGFALEQIFNAQDLGRILYPAFDFLLGGLAQFEAKSHIVVHGHVRVEGVGLEHHGDVAVLGGHVIDHLVADQDAVPR